MKKGEPVTTGYALTRFGELVELPVKDGLIEGWVQGKYAGWYRNKSEAETEAAAIKAKNGGAA